MTGPMERCKWTWSRNGWRKSGEARLIDRDEGPLAQCIRLHPMLFVMIRRWIRGSRVGSEGIKPRRLGQILGSGLSEVPWLGSQACQDIASLFTDRKPIQLMRTT